MLKISDLKINDSFKIIEIKDTKLKKNLIKNHLESSILQLLTISKKSVVIIDEFDREFVLSPKDLQNIEILQVDTDYINEVLIEEKETKNIVYLNLKLDPIEKAIEKNNENYIISEYHSEIKQDYSVIETNIESDYQNLRKNTEIIDNGNEYVLINKETGEVIENVENIKEEVTTEENTENNDVANCHIEENLEEIEDYNTSDSFDYDTKDGLKEEIISEKTIENNDVANCHIINDYPKFKYHNITLVLIIGILIGILSIVVFLSKDALLTYFKPLKLSLKQEFVELEYGGEFIAAEYIAEAKNGDLILPEIDTNKIGTFNVEYEIKNRLDKITKTLYLKIVDRKAATIELLETDIYNDEFYKGCKEYIKSAEDNVDGNVIEKVHCYEEENKIVYTYTDSSNNTTTKTINFNDIPKCDVNAIWDGKSCICKDGYNGDGYSCTVIKPQVVEKPVYIEKIVEVPANNSGGGNVYDSEWVYETIEGIDNSGNAIVKWED